VLILWLCFPLLFARESIKVERLWTFDAFVQLFMLVILLGLFASTFDVRLAYDWCFRPEIAVAFLLLLPISKLALFTARSDELSDVRGGAAATSTEPRSLWMGLAALAGITIVGLVIRAWGLTDASMIYDEITFVRAVEGIFANGLPHFSTGSFVNYQTSYEVVPYPMALSELLFGHSVMAYRLPSLIFGSCTIFLIGWAGYRMMNWRVGLAAAYIYAFLPTTIGWGRDAYYLSQESFFTLLTIWLFFEAIRGSELERRYLTWSAIAAVLSYLSWEGSAFMIAALFVAILVLRWGDFRWMTDRHLWVCFLLVSAVIAIQVSLRLMAQIPDYLGVVYDLSEISGPTLTFLDRITFNPFYYLESFFFADNYCLLTIIVLAGLLFGWRDRALRYLYLLLALYYVFYTGTLAHYASRYCFFWTSALVLAASGTFFHLWDRLAAVEIPKLGAVLRNLAFAGGTALLLLGANPYATKLYRMSATPQRPVFFSRMGVQFKFDFLSAELYVAENLKPGDAVIAAAPHIFQFYAGKLPQYWLNTAVYARMTYDGGFERPMYIDKWLGVPVIRGLQEFRDAQTRYGRLFIIYDPLADRYAPDFLTYLTTWGRVVHDGFQQRVVLIPGVTPDTIPQQPTVKTATR
jgi:hypothetical protein